MVQETAAAPALPLLTALRPRGGAVAAGLATGLAVVLGSLLLVASAKVQVPFWPVPMTMQSMVVLLLGLAYGSRLGTAAVLLYLAEGLAGLPVFAGSGAGPAYMAGPTAGYLVGFVAAAFLTGRLAERGWDRSAGKALAAMLVGHGVILAAGVGWLATLFGAEKAVAVGLMPFLAATVLKTALGAAIMQAAWWGMGRHRSQ